MIKFYENPEESNPNIPTKEEIFGLIKQHGEYSSEAMDAFSIWFKNKQKERDESESIYSPLKFSIEVADFCIDVDFIDEAKKYCDQAWKMMNNIIKSESTVDDQDLKNLTYLLLDVSDKIDRKTL